MAMNAYRNYTNNVSAMQKNLEKLSSGYKINRAGDDAAGLAISEKMRAQITGLETAQKNAKDGISLVQTAEGALTEVHDMLNRMVELATQSANGTYDNSVDRNQMQKEINQLLEEIDRIADSSNFNGINLLDGSLGLNTAAFSIDAVAAQEANDGVIDISALVAKEDAGKPAVHLETESATGKDPSAVIDLGDLSVKVAASGSAELTFNIAGESISVILNNASTTAVTKSTGEIGTALIAALKTNAFGYDMDGDNTEDSIVIGDAVYTLSGADGKITLTFAGMDTEDGFKPKNATLEGKFDADAAKKINQGLGFEVTYESAGDVEEVTGDIVHRATTVQHAVAAIDAGLSGIDMKLTADMLVDGGTLKIDGKIFTFHTDAEDTTTYTQSTDIDLRSVADDDKIHKAVDLLSQASEFDGAAEGGRKWKIGAMDGETIHFEQTKASNTGKTLKEYDALVDLIEVKGKEQSAANAGTKITITDANVKEGNTLSIDGKKFEFTDDAEKLAKTGGDINYVAIKGGAAKNLAAKLNVTEPDFDEDAGTIIVRSTDSKATQGPTVLGKGLTLQIGDTADSFNQLNVTVKDCHSASMGIGGLDISTENAAQAAVAKIKAAVNYVSDVRGTLGATQNRLDHTINNLSVMTENIQDAESTIRDVDVAEEMMAYTKNNILIQSAQAMLAQANQVPQGVLQLLG